MPPWAGNPAAATGGETTTPTRASRTAATRCGPDGHRPKDAGTAAGASWVTGSAPEVTACTWTRCVIWGVTRCWDGRPASTLTPTTAAAAARPRPTGGAAGPRRPASWPRRRQAPRAAGSPATIRRTRAVMSWLGPARRAPGQVVLGRTSARRRSAHRRPGPTGDRPGGRTREPVVPGHRSASRSSARPRWIRLRTVPSGTPRVVADLGIGETGHVAQHDGGPELDGKAHQCGLDIAARAGGRRTPRRRWPKRAGSARGHRAAPQPDGAGGGAHHREKRSS